VLVDDGFGGGRRQRPGRVVQAALVVELCVMVGQEGTHRSGQAGQGSASRAGFVGLGRTSGRFVRRTGRCVPTVGGEAIAVGLHVGGLRPSPYIFWRVGRLQRLRCSRQAPPLGMFSWWESRCTCTDSDAWRPQPRNACNSPTSVQLLTCSTWRLTCSATAEGMISSSSRLPGCMVGEGREIGGRRKGLG
jgi:hypothetical protein